MILFDVVPSLQNTPTSEVFQLILTSLCFSTRKVSSVGYSGANNANVAGSNLALVIAASIVQLEER